MTFNTVKFNLGRFEIIKTPFDLYMYIFIRILYNCQQLTNISGKNMKHQHPLNLHRLHIFTHKLTVYIKNIFEDSWA